MVIRPIGRRATSLSGCLPEPSSPSTAACRDSPSVRSASRTISAPTATVRSGSVPAAGSSRRAASRTPPASGEITGTTTGNMRCASYGKPKSLKVFLVGRTGWHVDERGAVGREGAVQQVGQVVDVVDAGAVAAEGGGQGGE